MKRVLDVGNCVPDHSAITRFLTKNFDCEVLQADAADDALATLQKQPVDLVVVNRKLDCDYSDGVEVIRKIKAEPGLKDIPVMLITNYAEHHEAAMAIGALRGFGKLEYGKPETLERLQPILG
jgi:CheY-like chemotaxis protein